MSFLSANSIHLFCQQIVFICDTSGEERSSLLLSAEVISYPVSEQCSCRFLLRNSVHLFVPVSEQVFLLAGCVHLLSCRQ